jgi:putative transposase
MTLKYKIDSNYTYYFITSATIGWTPMIINYSAFNILIKSLKYCQEHKNMKLHGYVIMPNHFHSIISSDTASKIPQIMRDFKRHTSQELSNYYKNSIHASKLFWIKKFYGNKVNYLWQEGYHPKAITNLKMFNQKLSYIHLNPVRKGYVSKPEHWLHSSARNYILNDHSVIKIDLLGEAT